MYEPSAKFGPSPSVKARTTEQRAWDSAMLEASMLIGQMLPCITPKQSPRQACGACKNCLVAIAPLSLVTPIEQS